MAIQRSVALPVPASEVARARTTLAPRYGALVWEDPERRVLLVRVPRPEPDPVNDVEEAIEFLRHEDTQDLTHCLLVGDSSVAQVYTRPLQDLMRQRAVLDGRIVASLREGLTGHRLFQWPEDPRRRWRLAVRVPVASIRDLTEGVLEEAAEEMGALLETPRMRQACAVYLLADHDEVRLEADLFLNEMLAKWQDEDRRRRAALEKARQAEQERLEKERERQRIVQEMERKLARDAVRNRPATAAVPARALAAHHDRSRAEALRGPGDPIDAAHAVRTAPAMRTLDEADPRELGGTGRHVSDVAPRPLLAESTTTLTARPEMRHVRKQVDRLPTGPWLPDGEAAVEDRIGSLRERVDRAVAGARSEPRRGQTPARADRSPRPAAVDAPTARTVDPAHDPRLARVRRVLEEAGYDVLESPSSVHAIDLAAERAEGDLQRVVVRVVERLSPDVARGLLKTARELDVDLVLCVADAIDADGKRLLVATKIKAVAPDEVAQALAPLQW